MRTIKFRFWDKKYNYLSNPIELFEMMKDCKNIKDFDELIAMQFTGLLDSTGKEIYENDILICHEKSYVVKYGKYDIGCNGGEYSFIVHGFYIEDEYAYWLMVEEKLEIIGNIHSNPELLESK